jgi:hypothetical protein
MMAETDQKVSYSDFLISWMASSRNHSQNHEIAYGTRSAYSMYTVLTSKFTFALLTCSALLSDVC